MGFFVVILICMDVLVPLIYIIFSSACLLETVNHLHNYKIKLFLVRKYSHCLRFFAIVYKIARMVLNAIKEKFVCSENILSF